MTIFKSAVFSLLLSIPILGSASPISLTASPVFGADSITAITPNPTSANAVVVTTSPQFMDSFMLTIGQNWTGSISFANSPNPLSSGGANISPLNIYELMGGNLVNIGQNDKQLTGLGPGSYDFIVSGQTTGAFGLYSVVASVSSVPLPAAVWLFGTALFGFLSLSKRNHRL